MNPTAFTLRTDQLPAVEHALAWFATAQPGDRCLYAAPTGFGKSYIQLALLAALPHAWLVTPRQEIVVGLLEKLGCKTAGVSQATVEAYAHGHRIITPIRLRNAMLAGRWEAAVEQLIWDEGHHLEAASWQSVELLAGQVPAVAYTATPFRGTPRSTAAFRDNWGEPTWIITYPEAVAAGHISMPKCQVVPLLDDDVLTVQAGDFSVTAVERETTSRLADAVQLISFLWDATRRPTMVSVPTTELARQLSAALTLVGVPSCLVTAATSPTDRQAAFEACVRSEAILVQINVVSEGVDLPIRRLVDLSPTLSPVRWLQQLGRITRPVGRVSCPECGEDGTQLFSDCAACRGKGAPEPPPEYICCNRNLLRHAYLLEGCMPAQSLIQAQQAFPPSNRDAVRVLGLEAIGRLRPAPLPLADGLQGTVYAFSAVNGAAVRQYAVLLHPAREDAIWACRSNRIKDDGTRDYGRWAACEPPVDLTGFASLPGSTVSENQSAWWKRSARRHGLDPDATPTRKSFTALPVLSDLRRKL